ncbi:MAG: MmcQ/YjbR family DNA-binding protein, partial [Pyrinomonadaceae bacterium]
MALEFPGAETAPHFDRVAFKVIKRRSFATYLDTDNTANIFLTPEEQEKLKKCSTTSAPSKRPAKKRIVLFEFRVPKKTVQLSKER